jgi:hypothetical protein
VVEANGPFAPVSIYEDWEYECRAAARHVRLHHCHAFLADKRDTHHLEGRHKGGVPREQLPDYVRALERILGYAHEARVPAASLDVFSGRLFAAARRCAEAGLEGDARRCLALALGAAESSLKRRQIAAYTTVSDRLGWQFVGGWCGRLEQSRIRRAAAAVRRWPAASYARWRHRAEAAAGAVSGEPLRRWPSVLAGRWARRQSRSANAP